MEIREFNKRIVSLREQLLSRARSATGDRDCAEDAVQETLLRLWDMRSRLDDHPNVRALAYTILNNIVRDYWRHRRIEVAESELCRPSSAAESPACEALDEVQLIAEIVRTLPPLQAKIFRMKEMEGYDAAEIIGITGCTAEALRQNLSRARRRIREEYIRITQERRR
ncbi:MAG: sigma-70 family RNA polymerase sigma factor [Prevotella sp.]|nr:sigma-70 family RNA polymerase sigma factor [Prevotella sp.]